MRRRFKVLAAACAMAVSMPASVSLAHDPEELGGTPLTSPFGLNSWFFANFQTAGNPTNAANTHVTSSDIAFWGDLAYVGDYGGFRIFDISRPTPRQVSDTRCYGPQGDPSVFDRDGNGRADTLVLSVDSVLAGPAVRRDAGRQETVTGRYPDGAWEGVRIFDISNPSAPVQIATVYQDCGSHTNTLLPAPRRQVDVRAQLELPARRGPDLRSARRRAGAQGQPRRRPGRRGAVPQPGGRARADGAAGRLPGRRGRDVQAGDRPRDRRAARRLPRLPRSQLVPGPRHRRRGLRRAGAGLEHRPPDRPAGHGAPTLGLRPAERRLLAFGDVQLGRQDRQLHRRVVRRRLPDGDDEDRRPARRPEGLRDGQHVLLRDPERRPAVGVPQPAPDERQHRARPPASTAPRTSASRCRRGIATCSSTRSTEAARR